MEKKQIQINKTEIIEDPIQKREKIGLTRRFQQIYDIASFEFIRNLKKTLILLGIAVALFLLVLSGQLYRSSKGVELPTNPIEFAPNFLGMIDLLIIICATSFGGSLIAIDFEKLTGNILFPKTSRERLLIGRFLANYLMNSLIIFIYYIMVAITVFINYNGIPKELWISLGWALLYSLLILSFVTLFSSFMKNTAGTVVFTLILILIVFSTIESIFTLFSTVEPLFIITYYSRIISACFKMPEGDRFQDIAIIENLNMRVWITPDISQALIGMISFSFVFLVLSYIIFRNRQNK
ncbi:MAG: ABC transporter permease [Promethearchaeota archaeon]